MNDGDQPVAFRILATNSKSYSAVPNPGRVEPRRSVRVQVTLHALEEEPSPEAQCEDEFWIESVTITFLKAVLSLAEIWNAAGIEIHSQKMRVIYMPLEGMEDPKEEWGFGAISGRSPLTHQRYTATSRSIRDSKIRGNTPFKGTGERAERGLVANADVRYVSPRQPTTRLSRKQNLDKKLADATTEINGPSALQPATHEPEAKKEPDLGNGGASRKGVADEILDLTDQVASVALFGSIGVGKSFVARSVLEHHRTKAKFGGNCHLMPCDDLPNSLAAFLERLSEAIQTNVEQLQSRLQSSPPLILLIDGVDSLLDPQGPEAEEILATIEEIGCYEHVCLVTTSRIYPYIHGFQRIEVPALSEDGARETFYNLCNLGRSSAVNTLLAKLDFHPLSIELLASYVRENDWDELMLLEKWGNDGTGAVKMRYYRRLRDAIEPMLSSPAISKLGATARDVLEAIATFPAGVEESGLERILNKAVDIREVVDVLCKFSLIYRQDGFVRMLSPFQFYFLEFMVVPAKTEEVINVRWGPNCMPAPAGLLALFGRRVAPTILVDIQEDPPNTPPAKLVSEKPLPAIPIPEPQTSCAPVAYDVE
ncbi:hypothetical protein BJ322DRAFT_1111533 [Thelephora terrestris]|uniref:MSP domain-containing protein n=1 Tax=Thelephora terrestris TaxID=56493 RepID=A0A9P6H878_9AGAM|nr:hypothetical protein BJ322DRAFT_1111533 [Thelephora terrestris]